MNKTMNKDGFVMKIHEQRYWFPYGNETDKQLLSDYFKPNKTVAVNLVKRPLFGQFMDKPQHKRFRKLLNQILRAKYKPENQGLTTITVKLSDRTVKLNSLDFRSKK